MLEQLHRQDFEAYLHCDFFVTAEDKSRTEIELIEITDISTSAFETFSLLFRHINGSVFSQDTHIFEHPEVGKHLLFIGPIITGRKDGIYYQAIFNNIKKREEG